LNWDDLSILQGPIHPRYIALVEHTPDSGC
jgi:hypothetical protein